MNLRPLLSLLVIETLCCFEKYWYWVDGKASLGLDRLPFVTDFDGTIAFYLTSKVNRRERENLLVLPPSSSGLVACTSLKVINCLSKLHSSHNIICTSGMRESTMRSRFEYFSMIETWICENGGKIFTVHREGSNYFLIENVAWRNLMRRESGLTRFSEFKEFIKKSYCSSSSAPLILDDEGYSYMFRLKAKSSLYKRFLGEIARLVPSSLAYTFNLGHLDIHLPRASKSAAVDWLLSQQSSISSANDYIFMGDDDKDVQTASKAKLALIVKKTSSGMRGFVEQFLSKASKLNHSSETVEQYQSPDGLRFLWLSRRELWQGSEDLLQELVFHWEETQGKSEQ